MMMPAVLATCGLLFAAAAQSETLPAKTRASADQATWAVSEQVAREGLNAEVGRLVQELASRLKKHPEELIPVSEAVGPECWKFVKER